MKKIPLLYIKVGSAILAFVLVLCAVLLAIASCDDGSDLHLFDVFPDEPQVAPSPSMGIINPDSEMRGMWIATVQNINYPTSSKHSKDKLKGELDAIIEKAKELGFNAIFFQVRPTADALYDSDIFPLSKYAYGSQRMFSDGDFDILGYLLERAHQNNIRVHAWVNPLRVTAGSESRPETDVNALCPAHPARKNPEWVRAYADGKLYFDAGIPAVRELIASGVREIVERYDVDGIIFDDYFYPYPVSEKIDGKEVDIEFDDADTYEKYDADYDNIADFRRDNINKMIKACYDAVKEVDEECLFGVAPFGIWQNDDGKNGGSATNGLSSYDDIYCDPIAWAKGGYVDYLAPQIYWRFTTGVAPYGTLVDWWNAALDGLEVELYIAHGVYLYDSWKDIDFEITRQIEYAREKLHYKGSILYGYAALADNSNGLSDEVKTEFSENIIYSDTVSNGVKFAITSHADGESVRGASVMLSGVSDPYYPLSLDGASLSRDKNGAFSVLVPINYGENTFTFRSGQTEYKIRLIRK